jgi:hypothetical protein
MATEDWIASTKCVVSLKDGVAYIRYNNGQEFALQPGRRVILKEGDRIVSLQGCTIEVRDIRKIKR